MSQPVRASTYRDIVGGVAVISLMAAISISLPIMGFFCAMFIPLPVAFYRVKWGRGIGALMTGLAMVLLGFTAGGVTLDIVLFAGLMLLGFTLAECLVGNLPVEKTVVYPAGAVVGGGLVSLFLYSQSLNVGMIELITRYVATSLELTVALYENMGMPEEAIHQLAGSLDRIEYGLVRVLPAITVASAVFVAWINLLLVRPVLRYRSLPDPDFGTLNRWKSPEYLVWAVIACGLLLALAGRDLKLLALNGLIVLMVVYFFQGIAIVSFWFERKRLPRFLKFFLYAMIAMQHFLLLVIIGIGFFDVWLNLRKLGRPEVS